MLKTKSSRAWGITFARLLLLIVPLMVIYGHLIDSDLLTSMGKGYVSMMIPTAVSFIMCYIIGTKHNKIWIKYLNYFQLIIIGYAMYPILYHQDFDGVKAIGYQVPSIMTIASFMLLSINQYKWVMRIAIVAFVGYVVDEPLLYYHHDMYSTAMALHTALLFMIGSMIGIRSGDDLSRP